MFRPDPPPSNPADVVDPGIGRRGQVDHARPELVVDPVGGPPAAVAEDGGGLIGRQAIVHDMLDHVGPMLGLARRAESVCPSLPWTGG